MKRRTFDDSDETEIRLALLNCLNILEYIWWHQIYPCGSIANSQRMLTEINKSGAIAKIRI